MERIKVYNYDLDNKFEFCSEATLLMDQLNYEEISQATYESPVNCYSTVKILYRRKNDYEKSFNRINGSIQAKKILCSCSLYWLKHSSRR